MAAKSVFRHLCAEIDGFFAKSCVLFLNNCMNEMRALFYYMKNVQVGLSSTVESGEVPISEDDMKGIGAVAGVFVPYVTAETIAGSIRFTTNTMVNGKQRSERGLFSRSKEAFQFVHTDQDSYSDDINTLASSELQTSFVEPGAAIVGYIPEGVDIFNSDGTVDESKLVSTPPTDKAYYPYYGAKYLHMSEEFVYQTYMTYEVYYYLVLYMQQIRYRGASIKLFADITKLLMEDYVYDITFTSSGIYAIVNYKLYANSELTYKLQKIYTWKQLVAQKFPQFVLNEVS